MSASRIAVLSRTPAGSALAESLAPLGAEVTLHDEPSSAFSNARSGGLLIAIDATGSAQEGIDWIREARRQAAVEALLALVDRDDALNAVLALEVGADALLEMPAHPRVACAYARRLMRPRRGDAMRLRVGALEMHLGSRSVRVHGREVHLPDSEFDLLACLARRPGEALGREELLEGAPTSAPALGRVIDSRICRLRGRLAQAGGPCVVTLRGRGYLLSDAPALAA